jgi:hypothetical protein
MRCSKCVSERVSACSGKSDRIELTIGLLTCSRNSHCPFVFHRLCQITAWENIVAKPNASECVEALRCMLLISLLLEDGGITTTVH